LSSDNVEERKEQHNDVVKLLAGRLDQVNHPHARAAIVWIIGEYLGKVDGLTNIAPDVLRKLAKTFPEEDDVVKLQTLNLAAKLYIFYASLAEPETAPVETKTIFNTVGLLLQYVFNLAKYDLNYDIRDRCRLLRKILVEDKSPFLKQHAKALFVTEKPSPITKAPTDSSLEDKFALGTLAHVLNQATKNYLPIPEWAIEKPPSTIRNSKVTVQLLYEIVHLLTHHRKLNGKKWNIHERRARAARMQRNSGPKKRAMRKISTAMKIATTIRA
jgi:AP-3 complex subunit beta